MTERSDRPGKEAGQPTVDELLQRIAAWRHVAGRAEQRSRESEVRRVALEGELERLQAELAEAQTRAMSAEAEADRARREAAAAQRDLQQARQLVAQRRRDAEAAINTMVIGLRGVRDDVDRIGRSTAWRVGHRLARVGTGLRFRRSRTPGAVVAARERIDKVMATLDASRGAAPAPARTDGPELEEGPRPGPDAKLGLATRLRARLGPVPQRSDWPGVSIIVLNLNGGSLLGRLLDGLGGIDYPTLELIVVDHASTDGSADLPERAALPFPVSVRRKAVNQTFALSCNEAIEDAKHGLLLFLSNDAEPFESGWLKELVESLLASGRAATGATLLSTTLKKAPAAAPKSPLSAILQDGLDELPSGFSIQQRGLRVGRNGPLAHPIPVDAGRDPLDATLGLDPPAIAASAACLLVQREAFERAGGFDTAFRYGSEDLDLAFSLMSDGQSVGCSGRSLLFHEGAATQRTLTEETADGNRTANRRRLHKTWGPALARELRLALARTDRAWIGDEALRVVLAGGPGSTRAEADLADALAGFGWNVARAERGAADPFPKDTDVMVSLSHEIDARSVPDGTIAIAWIEDTPELWVATPWLDRYDLLLAASEALGRAVATATGRQPTVFPRATNPRRATLAPGKVVIDEGSGMALDQTVFDALGAGTLVVGGCPQARELFGADYPVFENAEDRQNELDALTQDDARRTQLARRYQREVLAEHTYACRAARLRSLIQASIDRLSFCIKISAPDWERAARGGDLYVAQDLVRALKRLGHRGVIQVLPEWEQEEGLAFDIALHLRGRSTYTPSPGQFNVLWVISHPEEVSVEETNLYDLVCVASSRFAEQLRERTATPVAVLEQATDPWRFFTDPDPALAHDLVFVGNSRGARRPLLDALLPVEADLAVWGGGLSGTPAARHVQGEWFANEELRKVYSSAKITLCDHWEDMRLNGFASNRLYDAVACGSIVVCDAVDGVEEKFGGSVVTFGDADELRSIIRRLLQSEDERQRRADGARERVMRAHTFDHRAADLVALVETHLPASAHRRRIAAL